MDEWEPSTPELDDRLWKTTGSEGGPGSLVDPGNAAVGCGPPKSESEVYFRSGRKRVVEARENWHCGAVARKSRNGTSRNIPSRQEVRQRRG